MKIRTIIIFLAALVSTAFAQSSGHISSSQVATSILKPATFTTVSEAKNMIAEIIEVIGIKQNFEIMAAKIDNAAAVVYRGKRYILYNPDFINRLDAAAGNRWASVSILAHEVGHHLNGHTLEAIGNQPAKELEADDFSGFVLRRMGATLAEAQAAMKIAASYKQSLTHPGKADRLTSIAAGWNRANVQQGGKDLAKTTPKQNTEVYAQRTQPQQQEVYRQPVERKVEPTQRKSSVIDERYIVADITFAAQQQASFFVTTRFNIVREMDNRLYSIGKMVETNSTVYPYIITDEAGTRLWVDSRGNILNGSSRNVGFLKVRK